MNAAFRHLGLRLWFTAFAGGIASISLLPWWQQVLGVGWLAIPAAAIMATCFAGVGWVMNRIGLIFLNRHVHEATVWERAGMMTEAEKAFRKAMAAFDSFWLSPILRRGKHHWFSGLMARFYLGQKSESGFARSLTATHLKHFPDDKAVAEPWLEQLLTYERHLPQEHEAAALVSERLAHHRQIQRLLLQYYLANGRIDFDALQTYRRMWKSDQPFPKETLLGLARLLRNEYILNHWALQVYMMAYKDGDLGAIEGIAAAVKWLPVTEESRSLLQSAEKLIEGLPEQLPESPDLNFKPAQVEPLLKNAEKRSYPKRAKRKTLSQLLTSVRYNGAQWIARLSDFVTSRQLRRALPGIIIVAGLMVVATAGWQFFSGRSVEEPIVAKTVVQEKVVVSDPFTIQVAAYVKPEDAQRFVEQLKKEARDAFWTQAKSADRTWYQVKVSHFIDREGAQKYGQELKAKGLIDDFYVANYDHEDRNKQSNK